MQMLINCKTSVLKILTYSLNFKIPAVEKFFFFSDIRFFYIFEIRSKGIDQFYVTVNSIILTNSAIIGIRRVAVALLLVTSVAPATIKHMMRFITQTSR